MALIQCAECAKEISDTVKNCPHCGIALAASPDAEVPKTGPSVAFGLLLAGVAFIGFFILQAMFSSGPRDLSNNKSWVMDEGKNRLEESLKDPESVQYGDVWAARMKSTDNPVGTLVACGYFNARNGFGGMTGQKRFLSGPGGPVVTDEMSSEVMDMAWAETCIANREY